MRFETAQVIGGVIERYNIGPTARMMLELLPSFFLYPKQQQTQRSTPGLHSDYRSAMASINEANKKKNLDDIANV
jgi:hypothetical protein